MKYAGLEGRLGELGALLRKRDIAVETMDAQHKLAPGMVTEITDFLKSYYPMAFDETDSEVAREAYVRDVELVISTNEPLFEEHDPPDGFYILLAGTVEVWKASHLTEQETAKMIEKTYKGQKLAELRAPAAFGESSLLNDEHRGAGIKAQGRSVCLKSSNAIFLKYMKSGATAMVRRKLHFVEQSPFKMSPDQQFYVADKMTAQSVEKGRYLVQSGTRVEGCWFIETGELLVSLPLDTRAVDVASLPAGDVFGLCEVFDNKTTFRRNAAATQTSHVFFLASQYVHEFILAKSKHICKSLVANRQKWETLLKGQATTYDSVQVAVTKTAMKMAKYWLSSLEDPQTRRRRSSTLCAPSSGNPKASPLARRVTLDAPPSRKEDEDDTDDDDEEEVAKTNKRERVQHRRRATVVLQQLDSILAEDVTPKTKAPKKSFVEWMEQHRKEAYPILIVDDSRTTQSILKWTFKKQGCAVSTANDGREALDLMKAQLFTLVVCDIFMPEMDGVTTVSRLRDWELQNDREHQPILLLTKHDDCDLTPLANVPGIGLRHKSTHLKDFQALTADCFANRGDGSLR